MMNINSHSNNGNKSSPNRNLVLKNNNSNNFFISKAVKLKKIKDLNQ